VIAPVISTKSLKDLVQRGGIRKGKDAENKALLSSRELEIVGLIANGFTNKEIAQKLSITDNTSKVHIRNILNKLQLRNRQHLAAYAVQHGLAVEASQIELK
jgi:DNA-binding NarL/FixJ family response regulator